MAEKTGMVGIMAGDLYRDPAAQVKFGHFFESLGRRYSILGVHDVSLRGLSRLWNAAQVFHPDIRIWRKRFWKNIQAFRSRSTLASKHLRSMNKRVSFAMQIGALFDSNWYPLPFPTVIYTDYTAHLSALKPEAGRSPFTPRQLDEWLALERRTYQRAAHIFVRSQFVRQSLIDAYGIPVDRLSVVGGGVNLGRLPAQVQRSGKEAPTALFIGRDFVRKGGDILLKAYARIRQEFPLSRLLLLTRDPVPSGLPLDGVELLPSRWSRDNIAAYFSRADFFVLPSRLETWGDVFLEAMAYGLPSIGSDEPPIPEVIEDGKTGLIIPSGDVEALASALSLFFRNEALRIQYGMAARLQLEKFFLWDHVVARMALIIDKICLV